MSDEDYDQGFAEGYYQGLSTDKETSFLILAARIDELKKENEKLRAALKQIAETYNKPTTSKDGLAFMAATALKETGE